MKRLARACIILVAGGCLYDSEHGCDDPCGHLEDRCSSRGASRCTVLGIERCAVYDEGCTKWMAGGHCAPGTTCIEDGSSAICACDVPCPDSEIGKTACDGTARLLCHRYINDGRSACWYLIEECAADCLGCETSADSSECVEMFDRDADECPEFYWPEDYTVHDEESLGKLGKCVGIAWDLHVRHTELIDLSGLERIKTIGEDLVIDDNDNLESLRGLSSLTELGASLYIRKNKNLPGSEIDEFVGHLWSVGWKGEITICGNLYGKDCPW